MYCNYLEREGKWKLCEFPNKAINNFKYRMRMVHKEEHDKTKEYIKFEEWIEKRQVREQKEIEMRAVKIQRVNEEKDKELIASLRLQLIEKDKIIEQKDKEIKEEFDKRMLLMDKYDSDSD
tara:strand:+ start:306 stop:668 length:363 start_codon:yes stop_codon:yes gene_type:complete